MPSKSRRRAPSSRMVVIAIDGTDQSLQAFWYYQRGVHRPENEVTVLHCPELGRPLTARLRSSLRRSSDDGTKVVEEDKQRWLVVQDRFEQLLQEHHMKGEFILEPSAKPGEAIVKVSHDKRATMIVMGTRTLGSIRRTFLGSVSDYVVDHAHCPVIVCKNN